MFGDFLCRFKSMNIKEEHKLFEFIIKRGIWDSRPRKLIISDDCITFDDKSGEGDTLACFKKQDIKDCRYGVVWFHGLKFTIGREYQIYIRNREDQVIKINFSTFYGIKKQEYHKKSLAIINKLWDLYFSDVARKLISDFYEGKTINVCDVDISKSGVTIQSNGLFKTIKNGITWDKLQTRSYVTYFAIYSSENPADINKSYKYLDDWNTMVLYSVLRTIVRENNKEIDTNKPLSMPTA